MKILYDSQVFAMQKFGGISRYFYKLVKYNYGLYDYTFAGKYYDNIYLSEISKLGAFPIKHNFKGKGRIIDFSNKYSNINAIKSENYDVFHPTYYNPIIFPKNKPVVITAHDFIHEIFPSYYSKVDKTAEVKRKIFNKANKIIAISQNTKNDLLNFYPDIDEEKIDVVYHAIEWDICKEKKKSIIDKPYILFTGVRTLYKNFILFLISISQLLKKYDLNLLCTGKEFSPDENAIINILGLSDRVLNLFGDEETLKTCYENALCFVFPSLYEGFGLPILEAFASKCPIAISNTSCFPEIAGEAAVYFDPYSQDDMRNKIEDLVLSKTKQMELVDKGIEQFKKFSMDSMIKKTMKVYETSIKSF